MSVMNTSQTLRDKNFSYGAPGMHEDIFHQLYNEIISKLSQLNTIQDQTHFDVELNKLRKKCKN